MRTLILIGMAWSVFAQDASTQPQDRARTAFSRFKQGGKLRESLLFERQVHKREIGPNGEIRSQTSTLYRQDPWEDLVVTRVIQRDGKPLTPEEVNRQEDSLVKTVAEQRRGVTKRHWSQEPWTDELPEALQFERLGTEQRFGRTTEVFAFSPRPGYKPKHSRARVFEKIRGKVWLDVADTEVAHMEVDVFDTISLGFGILGRIEKGTRFEMERRKWDSAGVWFDSWQRIRFDLRVLMLKSIRQEIETRWANVTPRPAPLKSASLR